LKKLLLTILLLMTEVHIGRKTLYTFVAHHWAVKIGSAWYELAGAGKDGTGDPNNIVVSYGIVSKGGARKVCRVGTTYKDDEDISNFNDKWLKWHPKYDFMSTNCQLYAQDLVVFCCGGSVVWPNEMRVQSSAPTQHCSDAVVYARKKGKESVTAGARLGEMKFNSGIWGARVAGPKISAEAGSCDTLGAFVDLEHSRFEANVGCVKGALAPNINTGFGIRDGNAEATLLGTGIALGEDGFKVKTPLFEVGCSVM